MKYGNAIILMILTAGAISLTGCISLPAEPNDPAYAPVYPATPKEAELNNGAIYQAGFEITLYEDRRAHRVGDVITIQLNESTQAKKEADTELSKNTTATVANPTVLGKTVKGIFGNDLSLATNLSADREFVGEAETEQSNSLNGNITVTVSEVLPNGLLKIRGEKWLTLNRGDEYIRITGLVRQDDIGPDNTVSSQKVADARITYSGRGELADSNTAGWITRLILSAFFPF